MRFTVYRLQPDAAASLATHTARAHLRIVSEVPARDDRAPEPVPVASTERLLLDAWREAHWTLRVRMRDLLPRDERADLEAAYDTARRADNRLTEFYQARAEHLARRLRASLVAAGSSAVAPGLDADPIDSQEQTLLRQFRGLAEEDRASLVRLAARLSPLVYPRLHGQADRP